MSVAATTAQLPPLLRTTGDVLIEVSEYLPGRDLARFTNSCRVLRSHFAASRFWQRRLLSARYAEGKDPSRAAVTVPPTLADAVVKRMFLSQHPHVAAEGQDSISTAGAPLVRAIVADGHSQLTLVNASATAAPKPSHFDPTREGDGTADDDDGAAVADSVPPGPGPGPRVLGSYRAPVAQLATVTAKQAYAMLDYAFSACRAKPVATNHPPLLEYAEAPEREGAAACTLSNGHAVYMRSGFCNDPFVWVYSYPMRAVRVWVPEILMRGSASPRATPLTQHDPVVYGHRVTTVTDQDHVVQYGGLTSGGYQGAVSHLCVSWALDRGTKLGDLQPGSIDRVATLVADTALLLRTVVFEIGHPRFPARSFHGQCLDPTGKYLYLLGGLLEGGEVDNTLLVIDVTALMNCVEIAADLVADPTQRDAVSRARTLRETAWREFVVGEPVRLRSVRPRFGHSMTLVGDRVYIAGGYTGSGMFRLHDGDDLTDIHVLTPPVPPPVPTDVDNDDDDTADADRPRCPRWDVSVTEVTPRANAIKGFLGRCHTGTAFGPYIAFFGGTQQYSARLVLFDTRDYTIRKHALGIAGPDGAASPSPPATGSSRSQRERHTVARVSHCAVLSGSLLVISGGCSFDQSVMKDFAIELCPPPSEATARLPRMTIEAVTSYLGEALRGAGGAAGPNGQNPHLWELLNTINAANGNAADVVESDEEDADDAAADDNESDVSARTDDSEDEADASATEDEEQDDASDGESLTVGTAMESIEDMLSQAEAHFAAQRDLLDEALQQALVELLAAATKRAQTPADTPEGADALREFKAAEDRARAATSELDDAVDTYAAFTQSLGRAAIRTCAQVRSDDQSSEAHDLGDGGDDDDDDDDDDDGAAQP